MTPGQKNLAGFHWDTKTAVIKKISVLLTISHPTKTVSDDQASKTLYLFIDSTLARKQRTWAGVADNVAHYGNVPSKNNIKLWGFCLQTSHSFVASSCLLCLQTSSIMFCHAGFLLRPNKGKCSPSLSSGQGILVLLVPQWLSVTSMSLLCGVFFCLYIVYWITTITADSKTKK